MDWGIAVVVANAPDVKHVPGRTSDVNHAHRLQKLDSGRFGWHHKRFRYTWELR